MAPVESTWMALHTAVIEKPRLGYRPALDGIRAVAVTLVICNHAFHEPVDGGLGVDLFFVLSGFLITTLLLEEHAAHGRVSFRTFYQRRARRLCPALAALLAVYALGCAFDGQPLRSSALHVLVGATYITNIAVVYDQHIVAHSLPHLWTLAAEEQFYLVWPVILFILLRGHRKAALLLALVVVVAEFVAQVWIGSAPSHLQALYYSPQLRSPASLFLGCAAALAWGSRYRATVEGAARWFFPAALFVLVWLTFSRPSHLYSGWITIYAAAAAVLLIDALTQSHLTAVLRARPVVYIGRISYSLYLWHVMILVGLGWIDAAVQLRLAGIALSLVAAIASYHLIEQPFRNRRAEAVAPAELEPIAS